MPSTMDMPVDTMLPEDAEFRSQYAPGNLLVAQFKDGKVNYDGERDGESDSGIGSIGDDYNSAGSQAEGQYSGDEGSQGGGEEDLSGYAQQIAPQIQSQVSAMGDDELLTAISKIPSESGGQGAAGGGNPGGAAPSSEELRGVNDNPEETARALLRERAQARFSRSEAFQDKVKQLNKKFGLGGGAQ